MTSKIRRVGLIVNTDKASARAVVAEAAKIITRAGRRVLFDAATARAANLDDGFLPNVAALTKAVDLLVVCGGDGTMLRVASEAAGSSTPILGINIGSLGFLTAVSSAETARALQCVWDGEYRLESRPLIQVAGKCRGKMVRRQALNDFVISRGLASRLVTLELSVNGEPLTRYRCDGLIVSSPTGSTAYSLAAGGAVIHPRAEVFSLTPICPHTLSNRSVIVSLDSKIQVRMASPRPETYLNADGEVVTAMAEGDVVTIRRSAHSVRLVQLPGSSFFETLRRKLNWSGTNV